MPPNTLALPLNLTPEEIYPYLGMREDDAPDTIRSLVDRYLRTVTKIARPGCVWDTFIVGETTDSLVSLQESFLRIEGIKTAGYFLTSQRVSLFAVTIGSLVDDYLESVSRKEPAHALIFDGVASAAVEHAVGQLDKLLSQEIRRRGFFPTARFSPGYGDWQLSWQKPLLESIKAEVINLSCTPHFMLLPVKSVTAAIGWSIVPVERNYEVRQHRTKSCQNPEFCNHCPLSHCRHRIGRQ